MSAMHECVGLLAAMICSTAESVRQEGRGSAWCKASTLLAQLEAGGKPRRSGAARITGGEGRHNSHLVDATLHHIHRNGKPHARAVACGRKAKAHSPPTWVFTQLCRHWRSHATAAAAAGVAGSGLRCQGSPKAVPPHLIGCRWQY